jgi:hypothetical protein
VGSVEGEAVGLNDGAALGFVVGSNVGFIVGFVGIAVGADVGARDISQKQGTGNAQETSYQLELAVPIPTQSSVAAVLVVPVLVGPSPGFHLLKVDEQPLSLQTYVPSVAKSL